MVLPHPSCHKFTQSTSLENCLSTFSFFLVSFFLLLLCISRENRTKLKKILEPPQTKVEHNFANIKTAFDFLSTLVLRNQSKWRGNKNERGERYIMLIRSFVLKIKNNEKKILTRDEMITLQNSLCWWSLECVKNQ